MALAELAEKLKAEAVVVGCHGRTAIGRAILGSTSTWLSHHCQRPVVIVRDEKKAVAQAGKPTD
jgi:nucleotide-binding universal stress UspA family protein